MPGKTTRKTGKPRIVFLTPAMVELCTKLTKGRKEGEPLFRNKFGDPWSRSALDYRFARLSRRVKRNFATYTMRRSYITVGLEKGVPVAQMATLAGHVDTKMVMKHDSRLQDRVQHMREMATKVTEGAAAKRP